MHCTEPRRLGSVLRVGITAMRFSRCAGAAIAAKRGRSAAPCYTVLRPDRLRCCCNNLETARNVSLTSSGVRNSCATSGSKTTTLVPSAYFAACLPRTPLLKSYSGRIGSFLLAAVLRLSCFFIVLPLGSCRQPCAKDPNLVLALGVRYHEYSSTMRHADINETVLGI